MGFIDLTQKKKIYPVNYKTRLKSKESVSEETDEYNVVP